MTLLLSVELMNIVLPFLLKLLCLFKTKAILLLMQIFIMTTMIIGLVNIHREVWNLNLKVALYTFKLVRQLVVFDISTSVLKLILIEGSLFLKTNKIFTCKQSISLSIMDDYRLVLRTAPIILKQLLHFLVMLGI